ncbi:hypothetical protein BLX87_04710 [Bacillus sp. VT-16-64]|nr:hypothetical protein BLX87_04710 [Bacillus sp. VT-16-64]
MEVLSERKNKGCFAKSDFTDCGTALLKWPWTGKLVPVNGEFANTVTSRPRSSSELEVSNSRFFGF